MQVPPLVSWDGPQTAAFAALQPFSPMSACQHRQRVGGEGTFACQHGRLSHQQLRPQPATPCSWRQQAGEPRSVPLPFSGRRVAAASAATPAAMRPRSPATVGLPPWDKAPARLLPIWRSQPSQQLPDTALTAQLKASDLHELPRLLVGAAFPASQEPPSDALLQAACAAAVEVALAAHRPGDFVNQSLQVRGRATSVILCPQENLSGANAALALLRQQQLQVPLGGLHLSVPVVPFSTPRLPHTHKLLISGLPGIYALEGVTGALLHCAGLASSFREGAALVAGELLGERLGRSGAPGSSLPDASHLVAFVLAPEADPHLQRLPRSFMIGEQTVRITVCDLTEAPPAPPAPMEVDADPGAAAAATSLATLTREPHAAPGEPPAPAVVASVSSGDVPPCHRETADTARWWRRTAPLSPLAPAFQPATQQAPLEELLQTVRVAQARRLSPCPRAGLGARPPAPTPPSGPRAPEPAPPGAAQTPAQGTPVPTNTPVEDLLPTVGDWLGAPAEEPPVPCPRDARSPGGASEAPTAPRATTPRPGATSQAVGLPSEPPPLAANSPADSGSGAVSPPAVGPPVPVPRVPRMDSLGLPAPLTAAEVSLLQACELARAALTDVSLNAAPLQAGYHDALEDYCDHCPHPVASHPVGRKVLRDAFAKTHQSLPSPEQVDPRPLVHSFCRRALHQLSNAPPGPLSGPQQDRLQFAATRRTAANRQSAKGADPALLSAVTQALATASSWIAGSASAPAAVLKLFHEHLRYLKGHGAHISASPDLARAFCVAVLAQLSPDSAISDSHGGRPVRRAGRGGQP